MSDCVCIYSGGDGDLPEFSTENEVTARKAHVCRECGAIIAPGQRYQRVVGKWDGQIDTIRTCLLCDESLDLGSTPGEW